MIVHLILFRPRPDLTEAERRGLAQALLSALDQIPGIRRARVGQRVLHGRGYEQLMHAHYPYAAMLEFDALTDLQAYLTHPAHDLLARRFFAAFEEALMYDFEMKDGAAAVEELL